MAASFGLSLALTLTACGEDVQNDPELETIDQQTTSSTPGDTESQSESASASDVDSPGDGSTVDDDTTFDGGSPTVVGPPSEDGPTTDDGEVGGPAVNPSGPDFVLYSLPECSVQPGGSPSGADVLTVFVAVRNSGPGSWDGSVPWELSSDTGLGAQGNAGISTGSSFTSMQLELASTDYNRSHHFSIAADPANMVVERDEGNNTIEIVVDLPSRPSGASDVPCSLG